MSDPASTGNVANLSLSGPAIWTIFRLNSPRLLKKSRTCRTSHQTTNCSNFTLTLSKASSATMRPVGTLIWRRTPLMWCSSPRYVGLCRQGQMGRLDCAQGNGQGSCSSQVHRACQSPSSQKLRKRLFLNLIKKSLFILSKDNTSNTINSHSVVAVVQEYLHF